MWGLAHSGQEGVEKVLGILKAELDRTMALAGKEITPLSDLLKPRRTAISEGGTFSINKPSLSWLPGCTNVKEIVKDMVVHESVYHRL